MRWLEEPLVNSVVVDPDGTRNRPHPYEPLGETVSDGFCRRCGRDSRHALHAETPGWPWPYPPERAALEDLLELRVPGGEWWPFRKFVRLCHVPGDVEVRLVGGAEDANGYPVLALPPGTDVVRFEAGRRLRLVLTREGAP